MSPRVQAINQTVRASIRESVRSMQQGIKIIASVEVTICSLV